MEPVWELAESVERDTQFPLAESFTLGSAADDFVWSDFLSTPTAWLGRVIELSGTYTEEHRLEGDA